MKNVTLFQNHNDYEDYVEAGLMSYPNVSYCIEEDELHYNVENTNYDEMYLTIEITDYTASNNATITLADTKGTKSNISYSLDNGSTWTTVTTWPTNLSNLSKGDKIQIKGENNYLANNYIQNWFGITGDKEHIVYGNIASLLYGDNFIGQTEAKNAEFCFGCLFHGNTKLVDASNLILSLTKEKARGTYIALFRRCTGLISPPAALPTMDYSSYSGDITFQYIFEGCTSLTQTPDMTNMVIATACLEYAFNGCTSLTSAELPHVSAINKNYCYRYMFQGCTSLNYVKCLSTSKSGNNSTTNWLNNVSSSGTFVKDANATFWGTGSSDIPSGWTVQDA